MSSVLQPASSAKGNSKSAKSIEQIYQKKSQLEHILLRPDTYIGSVEALTMPMWVYENEKLVHRPVTFVPGLYKIFDEIIVNAADNKIRDPSMDTMKINIDRENNVISVYNNGQGIPIEIHKEENVYVPELIFGHLLTSSNYDDNQKKVTGGRNGYGAKLCNIFSTEFIVETADGFQKYKQVFNANMSKKKEPTITPNNKGDEYTKITFKPDLEKFNMTHIDDDLEALLKKRVYDLAGCVRGVNVYLNNVRLKFKDFKSYVEMFMDSVASDKEEVPSTKPMLVYERVNERWEVAATLSDGQFQQVSFVNSICTMKGGTHVNYVADQMVSSLVEALKKKDKKGAPLKPHQAKSHLWIFVNCLIENPAFDSQTKENMTLRASAFGSKCSLSDDFIKKLLKCGIVETIMSFAKFKQEQALKKNDGVKTSRISGITKLDDANNAGTKNASKCTLILTEGDSAKSLAVSGLSVVGRDNYGVFPLRGKLLNVREATHAQIMANAEITAIKQILGLQTGKVYDSASSLRYGHLMIMTDQDHDGSHIKGLIINFLDHFWPSLLKVPGFLLEFITPIVKVSKGGKDKNKKNRKELSFFTLPEYESWKKENDEGKGWTIKYYKGLGTSTTEDAKKYFANMDLHRKFFKACDSDERALIDMAFNKKKADDRKEWLRQCKPGTFMDNTLDEIPIADFVNKELILFSMADNARSIPNVVDGLKPGQRKILFACFKRNLKNEIKVAQLVGYVAEHSAYHHGEQSLSSTILGLAQTFIGSNNLNLLEPIGQFGTRLQGGKDAASPRYIFTSLSPIARTIFNPNDDALLSYLNDDGQMIEPEWYMPILPMVLVNGSEGIGTGWSSFVPNYHPLEIAQNLFRLMNDEPVVTMHPWYRGFNGEIEQIAGDKYRISGKLTKINENTIEITELPIRMWTQSYKEFLEEALVGSEKNPAWIKDYKEYHTDATVYFVVTMTDDQMAKAEAEGLEKKFKIHSTISTSNMVCFDAQGRIKKYDSVETILQDFYSLRLKHYQLRKEHLLDQLTLDWTRLENKVRFVTEIIDGKLVVQNKKKSNLVGELKDRGYVPAHKSTGGFGYASVPADSAVATVKDSAPDDDDDDATQSAHGYDYLLSMPIWNLTFEKVQQLVQEKDAKAAQVKWLSGQTPKDLWRSDLDAFLVQWDAYVEQMRSLESHEPTKKIANKKATKKAAYSDDDLNSQSDGSFVVKKKKSVKKKDIPAGAKPKTALGSKASDINASALKNSLGKESVSKKLAEPASRGPKVKQENTDPSKRSSRETSTDFKTDSTIDDKLISKADALSAKIERLLGKSGGEPSAAPAALRDSKQKQSSLDVFVSRKRDASPTGIIEQESKKAVKKPLNVVLDDSESEVDIDSSRQAALTSSKQATTKSAPKKTVLKKPPAKTTKKMISSDDESGSETDKVVVKKTAALPKNRPARKKAVSRASDSESEESFEQDESESDFNASESDFE